MDVMMSPVSLCTGVTYDRSSIQTWLSQGHNTCPATMQVLPSTDVTPNLTLRRLIHHYLSQQQPLPAELVTPSSSSSPVSSSSLAILSQNKCVEAIRNLSGATCATAAFSLDKILEFVRSSEENRRFIAKSDEAVSVVVDSFWRFEEIEICERIVSILLSLLSENGMKQLLHDKIFGSDSDKLSKFVSILRKGSLSSRTSSAKILESAALDSESRCKIAGSEGLFYELYRLIDAEQSETKAIIGGLSALIIVSSASKPATKHLLRFGIVQNVGRILTGSETNRRVIEKALEILALISTCTDGRAAILQEQNCITGVVNKLMKSSSAATEHGVTVLWSLCCMARDRTALEAVMKVNGLTKVLLVMQSCCGAETRQMCVDLVKVLRIKNSKSCLASYETKTTHIMPF